MRVRVICNLVRGLRCFTLAQANALGNVGKAYDKLGKAEQAIVTYNQELALRQSLGDRTGIA